MNGKSFSWSPGGKELNRRQAGAMPRTMAQFGSIWRCMCRNIWLLDFKDEAQVKTTPSWGSLVFGNTSLNRWKDVKGSQLSAVSEYLGETAPTDIRPLPWSLSPALGVPACSGRHGASCLIKWVRKPDTTWSPLLFRAIRKSLLNFCSPCGTKCTEPKWLRQPGSLSSALDSVWSCMSRPQCPLSSES